MINEVKDTFEKRFKHIYFENKKSYNKKGKLKSERNSNVHLKKKGVTVLG